METHSRFFKKKKKKTYSSYDQDNTKITLHEYYSLAGVFEATPTLCTNTLRAGALANHVLRVTCNPGDLNYF